MTRIWVMLAEATLVTAALTGASGPPTAYAGNPIFELSTPGVLNKTTCHPKASDGLHELPHTDDPRWQGLDYNPKWPQLGYDPKWQAFGYEPQYKGFQPQAASTAHRQHVLEAPTPLQSPATDAARECH
jgi:hypothetical protein